MNRIREYLSHVSAGRRAARQRAEFDRVLREAPPSMRRELLALAAGEGMLDHSGASGGPVFEPNKTLDATRRLPGVVALGAGSACRDGRRLAECRSEG